MTGVLILAHGSRRGGGEETLGAIADFLRGEVDMPVETAFMQFQSVNLEKGLGKLAERGCTKILLAPYFLFDGVHTREVIPREVAAFMRKNPGVTVTVAGTLGADRRLAEVLADRVREAAG